VHSTFPKDIFSNTVIGLIFITSTLCVILERQYTESNPNPAHTRTVIILQRR
jgi:hypothetical protein